MAFAFAGCHRRFFAASDPVHPVNNFFHSPKWMDGYQDYCSTAQADGRTCWMPMNSHTLISIDLFEQWVIVRTRVLHMMGWWDDGTNKTHIFISKSICETHYAYILIWGLVVWIFIRVTLNIDWAADVHTNCSAYGFVQHRDFHT